jgi:transposase
LMAAETQPAEYPWQLTVIARSAGSFGALHVDWHVQKALSAQLQFASQARRPPARGKCPRGSERRLLRAFDWLPVAGAAQGPAAQEHGTLLLHAVELGWHAGAHPPHTLCRDTRAGRARAEPDGRDHRQPERQGRSKGGSTLDPQGFDAGKKVTGRKRHILVDTLGLLLNVVVHPADVQDRDGARLVLDRRTRRLFPFIERIFADAGYQGAKTAAPPSPRPVAGRWRSSNDRAASASSFCPNDGLSSARSHGSATSPSACRDFERYARTAAAFVRLAMIRIMLRRLTRSTHCS